MSWTFKEYSKLIATNLNTINSELIKNKPNKFLKSVRFIDCNFLR